jgi:hypothetical protein
LAAVIPEREGVMNDGVWKEMRDEEGGQKENDQEKIAKDIRRVKLPAPFYSARESCRLLSAYFCSNNGGIKTFSAIVRGCCSLNGVYFFTLQIYPP